MGVIVYYRNRGAIYFTNEDLLYGRSSTQERNGSGETEADKQSTINTAFNVSNRIRQFVNATASPPDSAGHSIRTSSVESIDRPATLKLNGFAVKHEPILNAIHDNVG